MVQFYFWLISVCCLPVLFVFVQFASSVLQFWFCLCLLDSVLFSSPLYFFILIYYVYLIPSGYVVYVRFCFVWSCLILVWLNIFSISVYFGSVMVRLILSYSVQFGFIECFSVQTFK